MSSAGEIDEQGRDLRAVVRVLPVRAVDGGGEAHEFGEVVPQARVHHAGEVRDEVGEGGRGPAGEVVAVGAGAPGGEFVEDRVRVEAGLAAGRVERPAAAAAEVQPETTEDAGRAGPLDRDVGEREGQRVVHGSPPGDATV